MDQHQPALEVGAQLEALITTMAHGGEGIARVAGQVLFVQGGFPGDKVLVRVDQVKKRFARGHAVEILEASPSRSEQRCQAAAQGGGCCDFGALNPASELELKTQVLREQLQKVGRFAELPEISQAAFGEPTAWRTRVRLGVDSSGVAGVRKLHSREVLAGVPCAQMPQELADAIFAQRFTPGSEVVGVLDALGQVHIVEVTAPARGKRAERTERVVLGSGIVTEQVGDVRFELPATAFWQAHKGAAQLYADVIFQWVRKWDGATAGLELQQDQAARLVGWDLYGGAGAFVAALGDGLASIRPDANTAVPSVLVESVELAPQAAAAGKQAYAQVDGFEVRFHSEKVERAVKGLLAPHAVVLDPPRVGAGAEVIAQIAAAQPNIVVHIGCDPATFARDALAWREAGYELEEVQVVNAFPGTHHFETLGRLRPVRSSHE
ncbi:TRAM domain-containing protein [Corynebacterium sp. 153RC1]|uniref:class I SAM-dependent RNA methyltransferase n=1 Tax=unclassified Corynebacterium TaxID=2624378 RepID=UPI00211C702D|nr:MULTISPECIES: TRAM domain-containing protein [unclassified Corynebacterium]MCQ9351522.1 TRAM domain-containing protein [Corynebacterium sp. 209RC1]MCQ9354651.1 TRAM domain-containing protein [Corynebacterium sp. 1222RC1]MCQ9357497.1 TRAM domain-containing protein [Corynebacterium sp. 122RC1]MCQ9358049.1 TRAM domain-containing protein [Corynebacterium sp. 142RC1]MCQ9360347.1 TRAM domain-containing protein [Corynebacterium sp. 153RC1]